MGHTYWSEIASFCPRSGPLSVDELSVCEISLKSAWALPYCRLNREMKMKPKTSLKETASKVMCERDVCERS